MEQEVAAIYRQLGMDRPLFIQYFDFLRHALGGDLGTSLIQKAPVTALVLEKMWPTLMLLGFSAVLAVQFAVPLALVAAFYRNRWPDQVIRLGSIVGFAMPSYWIGLLLVLCFGLWLGWFPISGLGDGALEKLHHLFLPSLTISLFLGPILVQSLRSSMLDMLTSEYIEVARAKGLSEWRILIKHVLRNALIPVITVLAVNISWLLSGAVVVEYVFGLPGLGSLLVRSVGYRDYPLIQGLYHAGLCSACRHRQSVGRSQLHARRSPRAEGLSDDRCLGPRVLLRFSPLSAEKSAPGPRR